MNIYKVYIYELVKINLTSLKLYFKRIQERSLLPDLLKPYLVNSQIHDYVTGHKLLRKWIFCLTVTNVVRGSSWHGRYNCRELDLSSIILNTLVVRVRGKSPPEHSLLWVFKTHGNLNTSPYLRTIKLFL